MTRLLSETEPEFKPTASHPQVHYHYHKTFCHLYMWKMPPPPLPMTQTKLHLLFLLADHFLPPPPPPKKSGKNPNPRTEKQTVTGRSTHSSGYLEEQVTTIWTWANIWLWGPWDSCGYSVSLVFVGCQACNTSKPFAQLLRSYWEEKKRILVLKKMIVLVAWFCQWVYAMNQWMEIEINSVLVHI